jgi:hypothetical protein
LTGPLRVDWGNHEDEWTEILGPHWSSVRVQRNCTPVEV